MAWHRHMIGQALQGVCRAEHIMTIKILLCLILYNLIVIVHSEYIVKATMKAVRTFLQCHLPLACFPLSFDLLCLPLQMVISCVT